MLLIITIILALGFEFINGFHDTANAIATVVGTKTLKPITAIIMAGILNFIGALVVTAVAKTIWSGLIIGTGSQLIIITALIAAIVWGLITWYLGLPSSSSHAIVGGILGSAIAYAGINIIQWHNVVIKIFIPVITSPLIGFILSLLLMKIVYHIQAKEKRFKQLQVLSSAFMAFSHGSNDAQKTMGIITMALVSAGVYGGTTIPIWVILTCAATMGLGTCVGGWRIIKTLGEKITTLTPKHGFVAETSASIIIQIMTFLGVPISTTHVISSAVVGVGSCVNTNDVKWNIVTTMIWTWIATIPVTGLIGAGLFILLK
jgi:PiT family inorganic phosphate transporter